MVAMMMGSKPQQVQIGLPAYSSKDATCASHINSPSLNFPLGSSPEIDASGPFAVPPTHLQIRRNLFELGLSGFCFGLFAVLLDGPPTARLRLPFDVKSGGPTFYYAIGYDAIHDATCLTGFGPNLNPVMS